MKQGKRPKNSRRNWRTNSGLLVLLVLTAATMALLGIHRVWKHYKSVDIGYRYAEEMKQHRVLFSENRKLRLELESLRRDMLGKLREESPPELRAPDPGDVIRVD